MLTALMIVATISQVLGPRMIGVIARALEDVQRAKGIVTETVIALLDSRVDQTTVVSLILMLKARRIVATISQVLGLRMIGVIARALDDVQRAKGIVTVTLIVPTDSPAEQITV